VTPPTGTFAAMDLPVTEPIDITALLQEDR